jgi:Sulfatase
LVIVITLCWHLLDGKSIESFGYLIIVGYIAACLLVLPFEIGLFAAILLVSVFVGLKKINQTKISLTQMPLTFTDIKIAFQDPEGLVNAMKIESSALFLAYFLFAGIAMAAGILAFRWAQKILTIGLPGIGTTAGATIFSLSGFMLLQFTWALDTQVTASVKKDDEVWSSDGIVRLSQQIGLLPFILYSYHAASGDPIFSSASTTPSLSAGEISEVVSSYVHPKENELAPNIVLVLAESTFDPNKAFNLSTPVGATLLSGRPDTQALGPLRVNVVGGGTWVTEFETLIGVDVRFFGYFGLYTHTAVSPYIKRSLATYLNSRGYRTAGFYPVRGNSWNARNAYKNYGFQNFYDSLDLGYLSADWSFPDTRLMKAVVEKLGPNPNAPFFANVLTIQNHAPHPCIHFSSKKEFKTTLVGTEDFNLNCELNEYLYRLRSTDEAFNIIIQYLRELQTKTGRPYVVLIYGDHQPPTFTEKYSLYRTSAPLKETVFQLVSSIPHRITCCDNALPATLIPSLISAFVAANAEDIYLGINFYLYDKCGPSPFGATKLHDLGEAATYVSAAVTLACEQAREQAFGAYRRYGIF